MEINCLKEKNSRISSHFSYPQAFSPVLIFSASFPSSTLFGDSVPIPKMNKYSGDIQDAAKVAFQFILGWFYLKHVPSAGNKNPLGNEYSTGR